MTKNAKTEIDGLVIEFFKIFDNRNGKKPELSKAYDLFIPQGLIIKNSGDLPEIYSLTEFIAPREKILTDGTLKDFSEEETSEETKIFGNIAQRLSFYRKSGVLSGKYFEARGVKTIQFIKTGSGWRITALTWDDEREGFVLDRMR